MYTNFDIRPWFSRGRSSVQGDISIDKSLPATQVVKNLAERYKLDECIEFANYSIDDLRDCKSVLKIAHYIFNLTALKVNTAAAFIDIDNGIDYYQKEMPADMKRAISLALDPSELSLDSST
ncbi:21 kDa protein-like [Dorcoceras hygrometricum]|uniref:21 kDa protein-like n=1 Tax=Dorcoceras hygrometricum TaxID=472368 RepID=A0A2Z7CDX2_9LAMI|nr:21 kDa protein-like [Dorcoceras hygrometricum]